MNQISRSTSEIIDEICNVFKDTKNPNNVDLDKLRGYLKKDGALDDNHIFMRKLNDFSHLKYVNVE